MRKRGNRPWSSKEEGPTCPPSDFAGHLAAQVYRGEGALEKSWKCSETGEQTISVCTCAWPGAGGGGRGVEHHFAHAAVPPH